MTGICLMTGICVQTLAAKETRPEWAITLGGRGREAPVGERPWIEAQRAGTLDRISGLSSSPK